MITATASIPAVDFRRPRWFAANGVVCAAVAVLCAVPRGTHGEEIAGSQATEAKPNAVLASSLAALPAEEAEPVRRIQTAPGTSDDAVAAATPARWTSSAELSGGQYRWSATRRGFDVGMAVVAPPQEGHRFDVRSENAGPLMPDLPSFSLGLRRERPVQGASTLVDRATGTSREAAYVSKIGLEWKPAQSQVKFMREGLGLRLDGQERMTVRLRKGVLGIYMQRKF
jgi:hypothetical protein